MLLTVSPAIFYFGCLERRFRGVVNVVVANCSSADRQRELLQKAWCDEECFHGGD